MVLIRTPYDYENHEHPGSNFEEIKDAKGRVKNPEVVSLTNQADTPACDLNLMFARYEKTGVLVDPSGVARTPVYGDFSDVPNFHEMKIRVVTAEQNFMLLPLSVRTRFENSVQKMLDFLADSKNDKDAVKMGLKHRDVLLTAFADDGVTRITPEDRADLDRYAAEKAAKEAAAAAAAGASGTGTGS